jgi:acyl carrier protein
VARSRLSIELILLTHRKQDVLFEQVEFQDWTDVIQPKVQGAWSLHNAFSNHELDFFIMLSSISGIVGSRGQAAYAAANSFLDGFAHFRVSQGLPATVIDLGVVTEIGYVADRPELQATLQSIGVSLDATLNRADVLALVKLAVSGQMDKSADHQCVVGLTFEGYSPQSPAFFWATEARFSHLRHSATAPGDANAAGGAGTHATIRQTLKSARSHDDAFKAVLEALEAKISDVTGVPRDEINSEKSIVALGIDSLIAVEIRGWIVRETDASISTMEMMTSSSTKDVAGLVVKKSKLCKEVCQEGNADK